MAAIFSIYFSNKYDKISLSPFFKIYFTKT